MPLSISEPNEVLDRKKFLESLTRGGVMAYIHVSLNHELSIQEKSMDKNQLISQALVIEFGTISVELSLGDSHA